MTLVFFINENGTSRFSSFFHKIKSCVKIDSSVKLIGCKKLNTPQPSIINAIFFQSHFNVRAVRGLLYQIHTRGIHDSSWY